LLERATELDPAYADAYGWLSFAQNALYHVKGPAILRSAISNANRALSLDPNSLVAMHALMQISHLTGRGVEALLMAHRALEQNPEDLDATAGAALAYFRVGLIDRAVPLYQKALAAEPDNLEFLHQLARCYLYLGEYRKGIDTLAPLPLDQRGMFGMLLYAKAGQVDHARHSVRANLQRDPNDPSAAYFAGWVLLYGGDMRSAAQVWDEAARRTERRLAGQENLHHRMWLGLMYAQLGQTERALAQTRHALAADPRHPWSLYFTARIYGLLGKRREALDYLNAAIDNGFLMLPYVELELWPKMGFYMLRNDPDFLALHAGLARRIAELRERY
jgi:tetratricopeptide (TPR) repeat protein